MATVALIAGAGLIVTSQIKQGQIAAAQGKLDDKIAQRNKQALTRQAKAERDAAAIEEGRIARKSRIIQARLAVGAAKSGIGLEGASLESLTEAAFQFSLGRNLTLRRGLLRSRELIQRGKIVSAEGRFAKRIGKQKRTAFFTSAAGTALFAGSQLGGGTTQTTSTTLNRSTTNIGQNLPVSAF